MTKTYDGTTSAATALATVANGTLYGSDRLDGGVFAFKDRNVGIGNKTINVSDVIVNDGNGGNNYQVSYVANTTSTISPASLVVSSGDVTKTYDGMIAANGNPVVTQGKLYAGDSLTGGAFAFADKNAGDNKVVQVSSVTVQDGNGGENYAVTYQPNNKSVINRAPLTVTIDDVVKTYDGTTAAAGVVRISNGKLFVSDSLLSGIVTFADPNAGGNKRLDVGFLGISDGNGGANYNLTYVPNQSSRINPAPLTVSVADVVKTYDGTPAAAATPVVAAGTLFKDDRFGDDGLYTFADRNAGVGNKVVNIGNVTIKDGNGGGNYLVSYKANTSSTINPAPLTVSSVDVIKTYDGTLDAPGAAIAFVNGKLYSGDTLDGASFAYANRNVGSGNRTVNVSNVTVSDGNGGNNYQLRLAPNLTSTINPAPLTVSSVDVVKTYDAKLDAPGAAAVVVEGRLYGGDSLGGGAYAFADRNAGIGSKTVNVSNVTVNDGNGGNNYQLRLAPNSTSTINPAPLTVTAMDDRKAFDLIPYRGGNGVAIEGLVAGENAGVLGGQLAYSGTAQGAVLPGSYGIAPGGLQSQNYAIRYVDGALRIEQPSDLNAGFGVLDPLRKALPELASSMSRVELRVSGCGFKAPANTHETNCAAAPAASRR